MISDLAGKEYDAVAKLRAEIVRLLDEAFGNNYVLIVGYWRNPDGAGGWWNKRFGPEETPETIRKFIAVSREAEAQMHHVRNMAEWDAWLLYNATAKKLEDTTGIYDRLLQDVNREILTLRSQLDLAMSNARLLETYREELTKQIQANGVEIQELKARLRKATRRRPRGGPSPR